MKDLKYVIPALEVVELEVENAVMTASGEDSNVGEGW
jgi:hypothetical protein